MHLTCSVFYMALHGVTLQSDKTRIKRDAYWIKPEIWNLELIISLSGNILCFFVFTKKKKMDLKPSFINILRCLSVFDTIFLVRWNTVSSYLVFPYAESINSLRHSTLSGNVKFEMSYILWQDKLCCLCNFLKLSLEFKIVQTSWALANFWVEYYITFQHKHKNKQALPFKSKF